MLKTRVYRKIKYIEFMAQLHVWCERKKGVKLTSKFLFKQLENEFSITETGKNEVILMWGRIKTSVMLGMSIRLLNYFGHNGLDAGLEIQHI